jgi:hypothetical protein
MTGRNPFVVPGLEDDPDQPLCPWQDARHEEYYGEVGGQHEAYELFTRTLRDPNNLAKASRIVIVTGPELSGKTSLANRCVSWVQDILDPTPREPGRCRILPLRGVCPRRATVADRVAMVCRRLTDKLREFETGSGTHLTDNLRTAHDVLPLFGNHHNSSPENKKQYFIILLPSLELEPEKAADEVEMYRAALAGVPGILCVTESPAGNPLELSRGEAPPPISLHLRYLRADESHLLVTGWPNTPKEGADLPIIRKEDLNELEELVETMNANMTLGKLLTAVRKIYDSPSIGAHAAGTLPYVERSELLKAYFGRWFRLPNPQGPA